MKYAKITKFINDNKSLLVKSDYGSVELYSVWGKSGHKLLASMCLPKKFWLHRANEVVDYSSFPSLNCVDALDRNALCGGVKDFTEKEMDYSWKKFTRRFNKMVDNHGLKLGDK